MRIAMVCEHASPLAALGGVDAGGQNVHVHALAAALGRRGDEVVVHTRRDDPTPPRRVAFGPGAEVDHVSAGPPAVVPKDELLPYMGAFADELRGQWREEPPDLVHAHFWMSPIPTLTPAPRPPRPPPPPPSARTPPARPAPPGAARGPPAPRPRGSGSRSSAASP